MSIRVVIVDDSSFVRRAVRRMLAGAPELEVVGEARDGRAALAEIARLAPDVVTLDLHMPGLDGIATLEELMTTRPTPVVLLSARAQEDAALTLRALAAGAVDFVDKSRVSAMDVYDLAPELIGKLRAAATSRRCPVTRGTPRDVIWKAAPSPCPPALVVLGASTGGPTALEAILAALPARLGAAVLVVQHMPVGFAGALARRLAAVCAMPVRAGGTDEELVPDHVVVAPGGHEVAVVPSPTGGFRHRAVAASGRALPRLDVVLTSAAAAAGVNACAAILTGMGNDGVAGARCLRDSGGTVIAEAATTCVVYGMPRAVAEAGLATCVAPLGAIAGVIASLAGAKRGAA